MTENFKILFNNKLEYETSDAKSAALIYSRFCEKLDENKDSFKNTIEFQIHAGKIKKFIRNTLEQGNL